jgi:ferredoxin
MKTVIYYFSGTGNSFIVARDIADRLNGELISIPSVINNENISADAEVIGIVFPVYNAVCQGMPVMVKNFANKLINLHSKYIFTVCTCLGWSNVTINKLSSIIKARGGKLSAGFSVTMPDNSSPVSKERQLKLFDKWKNKLETISGYIESRRTGKFENPTIMNLIMIPFLSAGKKKTIELYSHLAKENASDLSYDDLIHFSDKSFTVDNKCNGCGICKRICPANDIDIIDKKPVWRNRCESCLACVNWCPQNAINGSIVSVNKTPTGYHHPGVKLSNMFLREAST